ncbi:MULTISPECIES: ribosomal-processing cysteine protease Prp [Caproicibacter]|uniref:Ribosomal processing cysteine protease Prp n=1 Tax=Caproicibacter fermentans TaxID=2576756 RepID=A0A7G8TCA8_9FIRM|nr:ribosomal-processing cysteine protease Prp [Caproicibacter fermentans]QNK41249.1 ribosomal-processing cysteine protease Prp [Caproicibacter fermentans]
MICAEFFTFRDGKNAGFCISGHSGADEAGYDIVCAAVSSAAYLTANTITDVVGVNASLCVKDGYLDCKIASEDAEACKVPLRGLRLHLTALRQQYPQNIQIIDTEV